MTRITPKNVQIEPIIKARLNLQTTQRTLHDQFDVKVPEFGVITSTNFISKLRLWEQDKKLAFYLLVGGARFLEATQKFYNELLKVDANEINTQALEK